MRGRHSGDSGVKEVDGEGRVKIKREGQEGGYREIELSTLSNEAVRTGQVGTGFLGD